MTINVMKTLLVCGLIYLAGSYAWADICDGALVADTYSSSSTSRLDRQILRLVTRDNYEQAKHGATANAVISGVPWGATYDDFSASRSHFLERDSDSLKSEEIRNIAWTKVDSDSRNYSRCIEAEMMSTPGLHAAVVSATQSDIAILVKWFVPGLEPNAHVQWDPGSIEGKHIETDIPQGGTIVRVPRPRAELTLVGNYRGFPARVILTPLPPEPPQQTCAASLGPYHFNRDRCGDSFEVAGSVVVVHFGHGGSITIPKNNPAYRADLGFWLAGDFNGDGLTDLIHIVDHNPGHENYAHVHFSKGGDDFVGPTAEFSFPDHAYNGGIYDVSLGNWQVRDVNGDGKDDLVHNPQLMDPRTHIWISNGDGTFTLH